MAKHKHRRIPKLSFTKSQNVGYYAGYRDPRTNGPRRKRFGMIPERDARELYVQWLADYLGGTEAAMPARRPKTDPIVPATEPGAIIAAPLLPSCLLAVANSLLRYEESRTRLEGGTKASGTIARRVYLDRKTHLQDFLRHLNERHGQGVLTRMTLADLTMEDIEAYNRQIVLAGYSASQVSKRMQIVKAVINRAGRPEFGQQVLKWNWDAMDRLHGKATGKRLLPTLTLLKSLLRVSDVKGQALIWMAIGLGFGQRDLAAVRVGEIDAKSYDLRRSKTGIDRFGETPLLVWKKIEAYLKQYAPAPGSLMFTTRTGHPIVHERADAVVQWWNGLRKEIGETKKTLGGFYMLRHLGATEFGSRDGTSIGAMKRRLGHSASSNMADVYMRPVTPEQRELIEWVRRSLETGKTDLRAERKRSQKAAQAAAC